MNVFALHEDPAIAARQHADKHVVKMPLESVQILNGALYERGLDDHAFYGYTHENHPCILWAAESWGNFGWLAQLTRHLNNEWQFRYDHDDNHTSYQKLLDNWFEDGSWSLPVDPEPRTPFALATKGIEFEDRIEAYREYYRQYKQPLDWFEYEQGRDEPKWLSR